MFTGYFERFIEFNMNIGILEMKFLTCDGGNTNVL